MFVISSPEAFREVAKNVRFDPTTYQKLTNANHETTPGWFSTSPMPLQVEQLISMLSDAEVRLTRHITFRQLMES